MARAIYELTKNFAEEEKFGLTSQMRRAAYSVPMNLVEGANRLNSMEYRYFVGIAKRVSRRNNISITTGSGFEIDR